MALSERQKQILSGLAFVAVPLLYRWFAERKRREHMRMTLSNIISRKNSSLKPPFPLVVREMLSQCRLAYLSTVDAQVSSSHLSLMRFTYVFDEEDGEVIIMSTNTKTKKFAKVKEQKGVALLVHDFGKDGTGGVYSITLNGDCRIVTDKDKADKYRAAHLRHNPEYPQFIVGDDIAILCVDVKSASICNINDEVTKWNVAE